MKEYKLVTTTSSTLDHRLLLFVLLVGVRFLELAGQLLAIGRLVLAELVEVALGLCHKRLAYKSTREEATHLVELVEKAPEQEAANE